jgi:hypothetical protein
MLQLTIEQKIYHTLRIAIAMCFIGHGAFGIITKPIWCNYFAVFGISHDSAYRLMPIVGTFDILMGIAVLFFPVVAIPAWLAIWGIVTALLRPLSGEPFGEFIERAGNFGAPIALLLLLGNNKRNIIDWFKRINSNALSSHNLSMVIICLRVIVFLLFAGHGLLNIIERQGLLNQYASLGLSNNTAVARIVGTLEIIAALIVLVKPLPHIVLGLFIWKMGTELFYPHYEIFEWIERGGSYGSILALWFALKGSPIWIMNKKTKPLIG